LASRVASDANWALYQPKEKQSCYDVVPHVRLIDIVDAIEEWTLKMSENESKDIVARVAAHAMRGKA
jgi:hypothetical protein